ncbi:MAG: hypothetical protein AB7G48_04325 [Nitrospiraceae bacterium]
MKAKKTKQIELPNLERQYETIAKRVGPTFLRPEDQSLEQPTPYRIVQTVTTYSAYEEPI